MVYHLFCGFTFGLDEWFYAACLCLFGFTGNPKNLAEQKTKEVDHFSLLPHQCWHFTRRIFLRVRLGVESTKIEKIWAAAVCGRLAINFATPMNLNAFKGNFKGFSQLPMSKMVQSMVQPVESLKDTGKWS